MKNLDMTKPSNKKKFIIISVIALALIGAGLYYLQTKQNNGAEQADVNPAAQAMPVTVKIIEPQDIQIWKEFSAQLNAVEYAEIKPQVGGVITDVKFEDGQMVNKGDVLYIIDPRPYKAALSRAQSDLNAVRNQIILANKELERAQNLIKVDAISKRIYDERSSAVDIAKSQAGSARAQLEQAKINLDFAYVKAPISGQVGREEVRAGNLVEAGPNAPLLTTIVSNKEIFADFEIDEQTYIQQVRAGKTAQGETKIPVKLMLNASDKPYDGYVQSFDNQIDSSSGTIRARAIFNNDDGVLLPGMFATIEVGSAGSSKKIMISEKAIGTDQDRKFVYIVNNENKVEVNPIKIGDSIRGERVVISGLNKGDKVITQGVIRIRPDMIVDPQIEKESTKTSDDMPPPITSEISDTTKTDS